MYKLYTYNIHGFCVINRSSLSFIRLLDLIVDNSHLNSVIYDRYNDIIFSHKGTNNNV